jgi:hypothetical protein
VATLSDQEIAKIAGQIDQMPAGQGIEAILVIALLVLLIILVAKMV